MKLLSLTLDPESELESELESSGSVEGVKASRKNMSGCWLQSSSRNRFSAAILNCLSQQWIDNKDTKCKDVCIQQIVKLKNELNDENVLCVSL